MKQSSFKDLIPVAALSHRHTWFLSQVKDVMKDIMSALQQTNSEKILLSWVRQSTRPYSQVNVLNFTTSWTDGLAFNALLHRHKWDMTLLRRGLSKCVSPFSLTAPPWSPSPLPLLSSLHTFYQTIKKRNIMEKTTHQVFIL